MRVRSAPRRERLRTGVPFIPQKSSKAVPVRMQDGKEQNAVPIATQTSHAVYVDGRRTWGLLSDFAPAGKRGERQATGEPL